MGKDKVIDRPQYYQLYCGEATPCICGLPKIHKQGAHSDPSSAKVTYNISKHLASILAPLVGNTPYHSSPTGAQAMGYQNPKP